MGQKVLLVEDDESVRQNLVLALESCGHTVVSAADGEEGFELSKTEEPTIILSDIKMPKMGGEELVREFDKKVIIILMTAFSDIMAIEQAHAVGADDFLLKPFRLEDLTAAIDLCLKKKDSRNVSSVDHEFCLVSIDEFVSGSKVATDTHIRLSDAKYILIARKGTELQGDRIEAYRRKGLEFFYVNKEDFKVYVGLNIELTKIATKRKLDPKKRLGLLKHTSEILVTDCFINGLDRAKFEASKGILSSMLNLVSEDSQTLDLLDLLRQHSDRLYAHSVGVACFASMIARDIGWKSMATQFKLSVGGLFHDIGKKEIPGHVLDKNRAERTVEESQLYESHPMRGKDLLTLIPWMPLDVIQICLQHHENLLGRGFPQGVPRARIHPLALVVGVANEFCNLTLNNGTGEKMEGKDALELMQKNSLDRLDPVSLVGLMNLFSIEVPASLLRKAIGRGKQVK